MIRAIAPADAARLDKLEVVIRRGKRAFIEVGNALKEIRDNKLYRATHGTFAAYVKDRFGFTPQHAGRICRAAELAPVLEPIGSEAVSESQAREVAKAPAEKRAAVVERAKEKSQACGGRITAKTIAEARNEICGPAVGDDDEYEDVVDEEPQVADGGIVDDDHAEGYRIRSDEEIAEMFGTSVREMDHARRVTEKGTPELIEAAHRGEFHTIERAAEIADMPPAEQSEAIARHRRANAEIGTESDDVPLELWAMVQELNSKQRRSLWSRLSEEFADSTNESSSKQPTDSPMEN